MIKNYKTLFLLTLCALNGCSGNTYSSRIGISPPVASFVKILHNIQVLDCVEKVSLPGHCTVGTFTSTGSGMAINLVRGLSTVITAGHVCKKNMPKSVSKYSEIVEVVDTKGLVHQAIVILTSLDNSKGDPDLCVLWVPSLDTHKVNFSMSAPSVGDEIYYVGAPMGVFHPPVVPIFKGIFSGNIDASSSMITAPAAGGSSGSAVLTMKNEIVGVVWAVHPSFHHVSISTNYYSSALFLSKAIKILKEINHQ